MKILREANSKFRERRSVVGSFNPFQRNIYKDKLMSPHVEMDECYKAYNTNSFFQSAINTMVDFIMGGGVVVKGEKEADVLRCEEYLKGLETNHWLREVVENTIKAGNGYAEIDYNPVTSMPQRIYPIADSSRIYINANMFGKPLEKTVMYTTPNGEQGSKVVEDYENYFIQKLDQTQRHEKARWYKLSYAVGGYMNYFTVWGIPLDARKIIHFKLNIGDTGLYGRSYMASALNDYESLQQMENSISVIARNKAIPRKIISYGDPNQPASSTELDNFIDYVESLEQEDDIVTNKPFDMKEWAYSGGEINLDYMIQHINKKIIAGIAPDFLMGMGGEVNRACYSEDTRTLTENGWKYYWEWNGEEKIATYNSEKDQIEFMKPDKLLVYDYKGEMYNFLSQTTDVLVSPEHKMWYKQEGGNWHKKEAKELENYKYIIFKRAAISLGEEKKEFVIPRIENRIHNIQNKEERFGEIKVDMNDWIKFLAWYVSEGGFSTTNFNRRVGHITLAQSLNYNKSKVDDIQKILESLKEQKIITFGEYISEKDNCKRWNIYSLRLAKWLKENAGTYSHNKRIPEFIFNLSVEQRKMFLDEIIKGDGTIDNRWDGSSVRYYYSKNKDLCDDILRLSISLGFGSSTFSPYGERDVYRTSIVPINETRINIDNLKKINYDGKIYCFDSPPNRLFVTERNGKVSIQGNTAQTELLAYVLSIYSKRKLFLKPVQNKILDPFIRKEGLSNCRVDFGELNFEGVAEKNTRIMQLWTSNILTLGQVLKQLEIPFQGKDKDVENMRYLEFQNAHMPDMFGGGAFGGDVGSGEPSDFSSPEDSTTPNSNPEDIQEDVDTTNSGSLYDIQIKKKIKKAPEFSKQELTPPDDYNLDSDGDFEKKSVKITEQNDGPIDFPLNPTGTKVLASQYAIAIRRSFRHAYDRINGYIERNKQKFSESILTEATLPIDGVEVILNSLGIAVRDLAPVVEMYTGISWRKGMEAISKQLGMEATIPVDLRLANALSKSQYGWIEKYGKEKETQLRSTLTEGITQGDSITTLKNTIKNTLRTTSWRSEVIARSETIKTWNMAALESMKNSGVVEKVRWVTSYDERACTQCRPLNNQVWPVRSRQVKRPVTDTHPNCRCSLAPAMKSEEFYSDLRQQDKDWRKGEPDYSDAGRR